MPRTGGVSCPGSGPMPGMPPMTGPACQETPGLRFGRRRRPVRGCRSQRPARTWPRRSPPVPGFGARILRRRSVSHGCTAASRWPRSRLRNGVAGHAPGRAPATVHRQGGQARRPARCVSQSEPTHARRPGPEDRHRGQVRMTSMLCSLRAPGTRRPRGSTVLTADPLRRPGRDRQPLQEHAQHPQNVVPARLRERRPQIPLRDPCQRRHRGRTPASAPSTTPCLPPTRVPAAAQPTPPAGAGPPCR
jgi:hypothetical protein